MCFLSWDILTILLGTHIVVLASVVVLFFRLPIRRYHQLSNGSLSGLVF